MATVGRVSAVPAGVDANVHVTLSGRVINTHGEIVANDAASFWSGSLSAAVRYTMSS